MANTSKKKKTTAAKKTSTAKKRTSSAKQTKMKASLSPRVTAIVLFAAALFMLAVALIPSEAAGWRMLHGILTGLFGLCAYVVPLLLGYAAVAIALNKDRATFMRPLWCIGGVMLLVQMLLEIFVSDAASVSYGQALVTAYKNGAMLFTGGGVNGGALGALLGYPMEYFFSDIGSKIILGLLLFVLVMVWTGASLLSLWKPVKKTADVTRDAIRQTRETIEERRESRPAKREKTEKEPANRSRIDIDMGEGYTPAETREPAEVLKDVAEDIKEEQNRPQLRIDDIIGRAIDNHNAMRPQPDVQPEDAIPAMTAEEVRQEEAEVAKQIEEQEPVAESYTYPPLSLLKRPTAADDRMAREEMQMNAELLVQTLKEFGISAKVIDISRGPSVTRYELQPNAGVKISRITGLADDIALRLATTGVRIEAPIPNKAAIGIEVPNKHRGNVCLRELIDSDEFSQKEGRLTVAALAYCGYDGFG